MMREMSSGCEIVIKHVSSYQSTSTLRNIFDQIGTGIALVKPEKQGGATVSTNFRSS
jgi:hypothetical protein